MALWQYTFQVLPKESIEVLSHGHYFKKGVSEFDDEPYWKANPVNKIFFHSIQEILPKNKSWSNEIELYGNQESNCFEVFFDSKGEVLSASFRIDFRSSNEKILSQIIEFCLLSGLVILNEDLNVVPLNSEQVQCVIENSPQAKRYNELSSKDRLE
jgi:hypothetical protein